MLANGLVAETERLLAAGYTRRLPAMTSLGYRECGDYLAGQCDLETAAARIKTETHRYVRHQMTWLRKLKEICWFDLDTTPCTEILAGLCRWLEEP
jgi:tRNA dimethylallyltransferase